MTKVNVVSFFGKSYFLIQKNFFGGNVEYFNGMHRMKGESTKFSGIQPSKHFFFLALFPKSHLTPLNCERQ